MYQQEILEQMSKWGIKNPNQLSKAADIDYRTACKAVETDGEISLTTVAKIAKAFNFGGWMAFRGHIMDKMDKQVKGGDNDS